jgi:outer membrane protein TolC
MLINRQEEILNTNLETINKRLTSVSSAVENGVVTKSDLDIILSEKIKLEQQLAENQIRRTSFLKLLSGITSLEMNESVQFVLPVMKSEFRDDIGRPELQLFDLKKEQIVAGEAMTESKRLPKAFGFATLGYGNPPGNNFFKNEFAPYYIVGAGIKWNLFDWNKVRNEKQVLSLQKNVIENRKKDFTDNLKRQLETKRAEIESLEKMMETDNELISIRKRISASAESQYQNGTITATDYLNILNSERQALINSEIHKINLALAGIEYRNISGQEIE